MSGQKRSLEYVIPVEGWWPAAVAREIKLQGIKKQNLAEDADIKPWDVSRALRGQVTASAAKAISKRLKIPAPFVFFDSEEQALAYHGWRILHGLDAQAEAVALPHTVGVASEAPREGHSGAAERVRRHPRAK